MFGTAGSTPITFGNICSSSTPAGNQIPSLPFGTISTPPPDVMNPFGINAQPITPVFQPRAGNIDFSQLVGPNTMQFRTTGPPS